MDQSRKPDIHALQHSAEGLFLFYLLFKNMADLIPLMKYIIISIKEGTNNENSSYQW